MTAETSERQVDSLALLAAEFARLHERCLRLQLALERISQLPPCPSQAGKAHAWGGLDEVIAVQSLDAMTQAMGEFEKLFVHMAQASGPSTKHKFRLAIADGVELLSLRQRLLFGSDSTEDGEDDILFEHRRTR